MGAAHLSLPADAAQAAKAKIADEREAARAAFASDAIERVWPELWAELAAWGVQIGRPAAMILHDAAQHGLDVMRERRREAGL